MTKIITSGKRKRAVARAIISEGTGKILVNNVPPEQMHIFDRLKIEEPIRIAKEILKKINFDVDIKVRGGGDKGQIDAARISLSKAIIKFSGSEELEKTYLTYDRNMLVADVRRKEQYKPGDSKARSMRQSSKR